MFPAFRLLSAVALSLVAVLGTTPALAAGAVPLTVERAVPRSAPLPAPAIAATGYTYWGFYRWDDAASTWGYMSVGANDPSTAKSADGDVYGFRWALVVKDPRLPRAGGDFAAICASTPETPGKKRIGLVVDYGAAADADNGDPTPAAQGMCASVDTDATVQQALLSVTDVRLGSTGLICGITTYPSSGCGATVDDATEPAADGRVSLTLPSTTTSPPTTDAPTTSPTTDPADQAADAEDDGDSSQTVLIVIAVVVILLLAGGALALRRRSA